MSKMKSFIFDLFDDNKLTINNSTQVQNAEFWTTDRDAYLSFGISRQGFVIDKAIINLYNKSDKSLLIDAPMTILNNEARFKVNSDVMSHFGKWSAQVIFNETHTSPAVDFEILRALGSGTPDRIGLIHEWEKLNNEVKSFVAEIEGFTLDQFVELKMGEELANLETNYATRLTGLEQKDNQLTAQLAQKVTKDRGAITSSDLSQEVKEQMTGGSVAVVGENSVLEKNIVDGQVTPVKTSFINKTGNLFDGNYHNLSVAGTPGSSSLLYNNIHGGRTAIVPIEQGKTYTVKVHEPDKSDAFRIAAHTTLRSQEDFDRNNTNVLRLTTLIVYNDNFKEYTITSDVTGYLYVTVSINSSEPLLRIEEGSVANEYKSFYEIDEEMIPSSIVNLSQTALETSQTALEIAVGYQEQSRNLFNSEYHVHQLAGSVGTTALLYNKYPNARTAIVPIQKGKNYTVKVHDPEKSDSFRLATHTRIPEFKNVNVMNLTTLYIYNDILKEYTFLADVTGYVFVQVSRSGEEPLLQIEESDVATDYVPHYVIKNELISDAVENSDKVGKAKEKSEKALARLDSKMLFPKVANVKMLATDPGPRFIDYFDDKMWGYTFLNGDISYSTDEGRTWTVHTNKESAFSGAVHRLLPTDDGEVLAMTGSNIYKSSGWSTGTVTWSTGKVTKHTNAVLFQFSFDGDGTKFIIVEYANGTANWADSRNVWVSTDMGETFNVVWDSLTENGEELNDITHLHGACYDRWGDRFYFSQGHGASGGLYCSTDDGATWVQGKGHRDGVLKSTGITPMEGDTNGPTVLVATPRGLVMGSDNASNGMFGLVRKENPLDEVVTRTYKAEYERKGVIMFAIRGFLDKKSGTVYVAFRSEFNDVPPIICAGTPTEATMIYEYPNLPVVGAQDHFGAIAKTGDDKLVAYAQFGGSPYTLQADLVYPASEIQTIVRLELKRLGLIS